jgi:hypothetical protein
MNGVRISSLTTVTGHDQHSGDKQLYAADVG